MPNLEIEAESVEDKGSSSTLGKGLYVSKRLLFATGKAAWIAGTTFLVLIVPLIIEMDREQQLVELESQQTGILTGAPPAKK